MSLAAIVPGLKQLLNYRKDHSGSPHQENIWQFMRDNWHSNRVSKWVRVS
jgi:hypothetical protein